MNNLCLVPHVAILLNPTYVYVYLSRALNLTALDTREMKDGRMKSNVLIGLAVLLSVAAMLAKEQGIMALPLCMVLDTLICRNTAGRYRDFTFSIQPPAALSFSQLCFIFILSISFVSDI